MAAAPSPFVAKRCGVPRFGKTVMKAGTSQWVSSLSLSRATLDDSTTLISTFLMHVPHRPQATT